MKTQLYQDFWQRLHTSAKEKTFPLRVMFELTYHCNFRCRHCYVPESYRKYGELKTKEAFSILDQLARIGCFYLGFTGGEPFIRKDIMDILWYAKKNGFEVIIYTNGSLIGKNQAQELVSLRPNKIDITIPAMGERAFENITQVRGSHKRVFRAIEVLNKNRVNLGFKTCVLKENEDEIEKIQKFAKSLGALLRLDNLLSSCLDGSREPYKHRGQIKEGRMQKAEYKVEEHNLSNCQIAKLSNCSDGDGTLFKCGVGKSQVAITPLGELKMCLMIDYPKYKILESSLRNAWDKLKELVEGIRSDKNYKCNVCELETFCKWCPARGWLNNRCFTACDPESRKNAELLRALLR